MLEAAFLTEPSLFAEESARRHSPEDHNFNTALTALEIHLTTYRLLFDFSRLTFFWPSYTLKSLRFPLRSDLAVN